MGIGWVDDLTARLPRHGRLISAMQAAVTDHDRWRWFDVSCSLGAGGGDELSDIDAAIGYSESLGIDEASTLAEQFVASLGEVVDVLVHAMDGWPAEVRRLAVEYADGLQLDLVVMPAHRMSGLRDREVAIVDKDGDLAGAATSQVYGPPGEGVAREWTMMAWWWLSDAAKYLERGSLFEAAERIALVRQEALKLYAAARDVPYPLFGLTSLLDYEPFEVPQNLAETYPVPTDRISVAAAARCVAALLAQCSHNAATHLGYDLSTPWETTARQRLETAIHSRQDRPFNRPRTQPRNAGSRMRRDDAAVPRSAVACAVCQRSQARGSHNHAGDIFVCAECQADAKQFIEIQDSIWVEAGEAGESTDETNKPAHP